MTKILNLDELQLLNSLEIDELVIYFQPIIFIHGKKIVGFEALARGVKEGKIIPPNIIFGKAEELGVKVELDRLCRKIAFEEFKKIYEKFPKSVLFFNFDGSVIDRDDKISGYIYRLAQKYSLPPENIVIEITESQVKNVEKLKKFMENYKNLGFLIALDDVGIEYSNLNRIPELQPHILKIDRLLIRDINKEYYKQKVVKAIAFLAKDIGALTLAEGVETEEELLETMELGIHLHQGFYFSKPQPLSLISLNKNCNQLEGLIFKFHLRMVSIIQKRKKIIEEHKKLVKSIIKELSETKVENFENTLRKWLSVRKEVECFYIVNMNGIMITNTIFNFDIKTYKSPLFEPASLGESLFSREYIYPIVSGIFNSFITEPYVSLATGNIVITISYLFQHKSGKNFILCVDFKTEDLYN